MFLSDTIVLLSATKDYKTSANINRTRPYFLSKSEPYTDSTLVDSVFHNLSEPFFSYDRAPLTALR